MSSFFSLLRTCNSWEGGAYFLQYIFILSFFKLLYIKFKNYKLYKSFSKREKEKEVGDSIHCALWIYKIHTHRG